MIKLKLVLEAMLDEQGCYTFISDLLTLRLASASYLFTTFLPKEAFRGSSRKSHTYKTSVNFMGVCAVTEEFRDYL